MSIPRPSLYLNFANSPVMDRRLAVSRATTAGYFDALGTYRVAPANALPRDHDPATGRQLGAFFGRQRTNSVLYSRDLTNGVWSATTMTTAKDQVGVSGVASSASRITASAGNATILQAVTLASTNIAFSAFVKRLTGSGVIQMTQDGGSAWEPITVTSAWTRVSLSPVTMANPTVGFRVLTSGDSIAVDLTQVDADATLAYPTNPIETAGSAVTVNTDAVSVPGSGWLNPAEGTFLVEYTGIPVSVTGTGRYPLAVGVTTGASDNIRLECAGSSLRFRAYSGASLVADAALTVDLTVSIRAVASYKAGAHFLAANGVLSNVVTGVAVPAFAQTLYVGGASNAALISAFRGHVRRLIYWPRQLTTAQCQALSA